DVAIETAGLVLREDEDLAEMAVDAVREGEVNDTIEPAEGDGRLGPVACQRFESSSLSSGQYQGQDVVHRANLRPSVAAVLMPPPNPRGRVGSHHGTIPHGHSATIQSYASLN